MLITFRGRQYDSTSHTEAGDLARWLGIPLRVAALQASTNDQDTIDRALWLAILAAGPGSLTGAQLARSIAPRPTRVPQGVIACSPGGRLSHLPPEDIAVVQEFADSLTTKPRHDHQHQH